MDKRELEEELKRTSTGRKLLEETEFANPTNDMIKFAKEQCEIFPEDSYMGKYLRETLKMLQAEQCENTVSKEDVIKAVDHHTFDTDDGLCLDEDISIILEELPTVKPTRKKGKWIFYKTIFDKHGHTVECSSCHKKWKTYDEIRWRKENKFCPNCGVEMESEEE